jgi:hypothetical protein
VDPPRLDRRDHLDRRDRRGHLDRAICLQSLFRVLRSSSLLYFVERLLVVRPGGEFKVNATAGTS